VEPSGQTRSAAPTVAIAVALAAVLFARPVSGANVGEVAGVCAECHDTQVRLTAATGGHAAELACQDCHEDRRPGRVGRWHRTVPRCTTHHDTAGHPPHADGALRTGTRNCLRCHEPHGSSNVALIRSSLRSGRNRLVPITLTSMAGAAPGGFTDPGSPGDGLCEVCHRRTDFYRADGGGAPHFTESCVLCHSHPAGFEPVVSGQTCGICHADEATRFAKPSRHATEFACGDCHAEVTPPPGPGPRSVPACESCHAARATHAPTGIPPLPCTQCHDPHGTDNTQLVLDAITTTQGAVRPIRFDNLLGRADGSFASASAPGTGVCEICHTQTRFYRADATGDEHFTFSCLPCHLHGTGFAPP
jgi:predicted CXXCH cytochrome family protein